MSAYVKQTGKAKIRFTVSGIFGLVFVVGIIGTAVGLPEQQPQSAMSVKTYTEEDKSVALAVDEQFQRYIEELRPFEQRSIDVISDIKEDKIDRLSAYEEIRNMKDRYTASYKKINKVSIPKDLPDDLKRDLEEIQTGIATNYFTRAEAMNHFLDYIDTKKVSDIDKMNQQLELSASFVKELKLNSSLLYSKVGAPQSQ
ncbi:hypothetical protein MT997_13755 [Paenibacillus sp. OVF10]|nr:hypothetical protein MT997_13755 [Paenibacillus sp. OVF10]